MTVGGARIGFAASAVAVGGGTWLWQHQVSGNRHERQVAFDQAGFTPAQREALGDQRPTDGDVDWALTPLVATGAGVALGAAALGTLAQMFGDGTGTAPMPRGVGIAAGIGVGLLAGAAVSIVQNKTGRFD